MNYDHRSGSRGEDGSPLHAWQDHPHAEYDSYGQETEESSIDVGRILAALFRFRWVVLIATLLGVAGGGVAWTQTELQYVARASLWIQGSGGRQGGQGPIAGDQLLRSSSWINLLRSFAVLNTVVLEKRLYLDPAEPAFKPVFQSFQLRQEFTPGDYEVLYAPSTETVSLTRDGVEIDRRASGNRLGVVAGFEWTPPVELLPPDIPVAFSVSEPTEIALQLERNLAAQIDRNAAFIGVELKGGNATEVAATLNAILDQHVALAAELKSASLDERRSVLEAQLATVETELRDAERELETFRVNTIALPSDAAMPIQGGIRITQGPAFQTYNTLKLQIEALRADRRAIERVLADSPGSELRVEALEVIPTVATSSQLVASMTELANARVELRTLKQRYTDEHREVQDLTQVVQTLETQTVLGLLQSLVTRVQDEEDRLQDRIDEATVELGDIPPRTIEEARLERRVALADRLHGELRGRYQEAALAAASSLPDVRILDRAPRPTSPNVDARLRAALMFLLGGLGVGSALAVLLDRLDRRVQYVSDVTNTLGMEVLGTIPSMVNGSGKGAITTRQAQEAFRDLRVGVDFAYGTAKPLALTVTSPEQSAGKSTMTSNLAISFAAVGRRTLVIDGDTRRGNLHKIFQVERKPGLTNFLRGDVELAATVQATKFSGVDLIASGSRSQGSPEMLASSKLGDLLAELWKRYDVILVDSPPLGAGSDALILGTLTGQLALVVRSGQTDLSYALSKLSSLERLPVRMLGVILNGFVPGRGQGYYAYSTKYIDGYGAVDELEDAEGPVELGTVEEHPVELGQAEVKPLELENPAKKTDESESAAEKLVQ